MSYRINRPFTKRSAVLFQALFALVFLFSLLGVQPSGEVLAQDETKVAVITDYGVNISDTHKANIATLVTNWDPDAVVTGGDNYHDRSPACSSYGECVAGYNDYTAGYTDFVTSEDFFPSYGNHDAMHSAAYISYFSYLPSDPDPNHLYYDVVIGNIHFWVLNGNVNLSGSAQQTWLADNAPSSTAAWNIAVVHQAPYGTGFYGDITATQIPYQDYGIDFVISGHNHHYERLERNGVRYFIAGRAGLTEGGRTCSGTGSAATSEFCAGTQVPPHDNYGYMQIVATETDISLKFVDETNSVLDTWAQTTSAPDTPSISVTPSSLSFTSQPGVPSAQQSYTVSGSNLEGNVTVTPPTNFEISTTSGSGFGTAPIVLNHAAGTLAATPIYVRFNRATAGTSTENITHISQNATTKTVAVSGTASETTSEWTAYNDMSGTSTPANTTEFTLGATNSMLLDFDTGAETGVTVTVTSDGSPYNYTDGGAMPNSGTDAYNVFNGKVNLQGVIMSATSNETDYWVDVTFNNLEPSMTYTFAATANRAGGTGGTDTGLLYSERETRYTISGIDAATNASSTGVSEYGGSPYSVYFVTGENTSAGRVAKWLNIQPGADGSFKVRAQPQNSSEPRTYAFGGFMLGAETSSDLPTITTTGTLTPFSTTPGTPSDAQTYQVSGVNLTENITITAPDGFEIKTAASAYGSSIGLAQTGGSVGPITMYVRLTGAAGTFSGNITHTSDGAVPRNVAVSGVASDQVCYTDQEFIASADTYLSSYNTTNNYGAQTYMRVTLGTSNPRGSLIRWDLSSLPSSAVISDASLKLYVSTAGSATYNLYNMRRAWVEGTGSGAVTGDGATWQTTDGSTAWGTNGAASTSTDRYNTNLWGAGSTSFNTTGSKTIALNASGLGVVQGWVDGSVSNYGLTIQNYTSGSTDVQFSTKDNSTAANRPRLILDYCVGSTPSNNAPTDIMLSSSYVAENKPAGTEVGIFNTVDPDAGDTHTYSLVAGTGSTDNGSFTIDGNELKTNAVFDYATKSSYSIRVRTTDQGSLFYEEAFTITVLQSGVTPPIPSSFYGEIHCEGVEADDTISAYLDDDTDPIWSATITYDNDVEELVYAINVPAHPDGTYPQTVTLKIDDDHFATAAWVSGSNVELNMCLMEINLVAGWNLISFNVVPASTDIRHVLENIMGKFDIVYAWDAGEPDEFNQWLKYIPDPGFPFERNSLQVLDERMGFWINMEVPATLTLNGAYPSGGTEIPLKVGSGGWNLVGFPSVTNVDLPGALVGQGLEDDDYTVIWRYEAHEADEGDKWKKFYPDPEYPNNDFTALSPGWGYWIYITTDSDLTWEVD